LDQYFQLLVSRVSSACSKPPERHVSAVSIDISAPFRMKSKANHFHARTPSSTKGKVASDFGCEFRIADSRIEIKPIAGPQARSF
jgi:hypothetical protein